MVINTPYEGWLDSLKQAASAVIPSHTIVGKYLSGDTAGATKDLAKWGTQTYASATQKQATPTAEQIAAQRLYYQQAGAGLPFGMSMNTLLVIGAASIGVFLLTRRGRRR